MKYIFLALVLLCLGTSLSAQYVYTIKADSVKITNCDSSELIIENHTQNIPGFLFNTGNGRTQFRRGAIKLSDSTYQVGSDTVKILPSSQVWLLNGNTGTNSAHNFLGTTDNSDLVFKTNNIERGRFFGSNGTFVIGDTTFYFSSAERFQVNGDARANAMSLYPSHDTSALTITYHSTDLQRYPAILFNYPGIITGLDVETGRIFSDRNQGGLAFGAKAAVGATGSNYVAIGHNTVGNGSFSGLDAVAVGNGALSSLTNADFNVGIGGGALGELTNGGYNIGIGSNALATATTAFTNVGIGPFSLFTNNGNYNVAIGTNSGYYNASGSNNILIGVYAGLFNQSGSNNVMIGKQAGNNGTSGSGNVFIGYQAGGLELGSNLLYINNSASSSPLIYGDFSARLLRGNANTFQITGASFFGGTTAPTAKVHIAGSNGSAGTAPVKLTTGTLLTTPEDGAIEYDGTSYYADVSTVRYTLAKTLTTTATLDFPGTGAQSSSDLTVTLNGVSVGDVVAIGPDNASVNANSCYTAWVSSANTVTVRFNNYSTGAIDPSSGTFRVSVMKY